MDVFDEQCLGYPRDELETKSVMGSYAPFLAASLRLCPELLLKNLIDLGMTTFSAEKRPHEEIKQAKEAYELLKNQLGEPYKKR